jgi:hypothetical protein
MNIQAWIEEKAKTNLASQDQLTIRIDIAEMLMYLAYEKGREDKELEIKALFNSIEKGTVLIKE